MDLKPALELIQTTAVEAKAVRIERPAGIAADQFYLVRPDGSVELHTLPPRPRAYEAFTVRGVREQIRYLAGLTHGVTVFVGRSSVEAVVDEPGDNIEGRRDRVSMVLEYSEPFIALRDWRLSLRAKTQKEFVYVLRTMFAGAGRIDPPGFLEAVREIKMVRDSAGSSTVRTGKESMDRSVVAEVSGIGGDFPEQVTLRCPVYENVPAVTLEPARILCDVDIDVLEQTFTLRPLPGEIEDALDQANAWLAGEIAEGLPEGVTVLASSAAEREG